VAQDLDTVPASRGPSPGARLRARLPSAEFLIIGVAALFGFRQGARPIHDNSMFTHMRTGIDIVQRGSIPHHDPYSFTAHGHSWVVQSWLPSWTYGWAHKLGGFQLVVIEQAVLMAVLAALVANLARAGSAPRTFVAALIAVCAGTVYWVQRPLLFGLIAMALTITIVERRHSRWWFIPLVWVWVSSHGSFPLALVWFGARGVGEALDSRGIPKVTIHYLIGMVTGLVVAIANPLGVRLLTFPLTVGDKRIIFQRIIEWNSPNFQLPVNFFTLVFLTIAFVLLLHRGVRWADAIPAAGFVALGLIAQRNLPVAAIILAPAIGRALTARDPEEAGRQRWRVPSTVKIGVMAGIAAQLVVLVAGVYGHGSLQLKNYPVAAVDFLEKSGLRGPSHRVAQQDVVGNYFEARFDRDARVFMDDRYDMYPNSVADDYGHLLLADQEALRVLDRRQVDVVLWNVHLPLVATLEASPKWNKVYLEGHWEVFQRV
jgi:hypothetical protein